MATIKEVILAQLGYKIPDATIDVIMMERGLNPTDERDTSDDEQSRAIDLSRADAIDFLIMQPKSVKELDYQITQQDADALLAIRRRLLWKWGEDDTPSDTLFVDLSNTH